jgi:hypothetical protein
LSSCLSEELKQDLLARFKLSNGGYDLAFKYLKDKYSNKRAITNKHLSELLKSKLIEKENAKDLRALLDCYCVNIDQAKRINPDGNLFDLLIVFMVSSRLDKHHKEGLGSSHQKRSLSTVGYNEIIIAARVTILERMNYDKQCSVSDESRKKFNNAYKSKPVSSSSSFKPTTAMSNQTLFIRCAICKIDHKTHTCPELLNIDVAARVQKVKELKLCFNCLKNHNRNNCNNKFSCRECFKLGKPNEHHHTILHYNKQPQNQQGQNKETQSKSMANQENQNITVTQSSQVPKVVQSHHAHVSSEQSHVFLLTAIINIENRNGDLFPCRALLDSGSESCFITENVAQRLGIHRTKVSVLVYGLGEKPLEVKHQIETNIHSRMKKYVQSVSFLVVPKISGKIPREKIELKI